MAIGKEQALEIIKNEIFKQICSNVEYFGDEPSDNWNIYNLPLNCYYFQFGNAVVFNFVIQSSIVIAIDKETGKIRYFGSANNEG